MRDSSFRHIVDSSSISIYTCILIRCHFEGNITDRGENINELPPKAVSRQLPQVVLVQMVRIYLQKKIVTAVCCWQLSAIKTERSCLTDFRGSDNYRTAPAVVSWRFLALPGS